MLEPEILKWLPWNLSDSKVAEVGFTTCFCIQMNNINATLGEQKKLKCSLLLKWQSNTSSNDQEQISKGLHLQGDMDMSAIFPVLLLCITMPCELDTL